MLSVASLSKKVSLISDVSLEVSLPVVVSLNSSLEAISEFVRQSTQRLHEKSKYNIIRRLNA